MSKVLVVDDDPAIRLLCQTVLTAEGYEVLEATSGAACLNMLRQHRPDLILLDWMMPEVDGVDTLRAIKGAGSTRGIPVVMLTALDSTAQINLATCSGADGYVVKPFEVPDLLALVRRFTRGDERSPHPAA
jgi:DNA-binding response OmpR family regulator